MNADDIYKVIEKAVGDTVPPVVEKVVNGKITRLQASFDAHREQSGEQWGRVNNHIEQMEPVIEALNFFNTGRKFALWLKPLVPAIIFIGVMWVAFKKIFE
jgi:hypothetical protein